MKHWLEQLTDILVPHIQDGIKSLYRDAKRLNSNKTLKMFQLVLETIPNISQSKLDTDYRVLIKKRGGNTDWMRKILKVIFGTMAKMDLVGRGGRKDIKIKEKDLQIPDDITFLHKCYIESARAIWITPHLFSDKFDSIQQQKNYALASEKIGRAIEKTIRKLIPFEQLEYRYLDDTIYSGSLKRDAKKKQREERIKKNGKNGRYGTSESESDNLETMLDKDSKRIFEFSHKKTKSYNNQKELSHSRSRSRSRSGLESSNLKDSILSEKKSESNENDKRINKNESIVRVNDSGYRSDNTLKSRNIESKSDSRHMGATLSHDDDADENRDDEENQKEEQVHEKEKREDSKEVDENKKRNHDNKAMDENDEESDKIKIKFLDSSLDDLSIRSVPEFQTKPDFRLADLELSDDKTAPAKLTDTREKTNGGLLEEWKNLNFKIPFSNNNLDLSDSSIDITLESTNCDPIKKQLNHGQEIPKGPQGPEGPEGPEGPQSEQVYDNYDTDHESSESSFDQEMISALTSKSEENSKKQKNNIKKEKDPQKNIKKEYTEIHNDDKTISNLVSEENNGDTESIYQSGTGSGTESGFASETVSDSQLLSRDDLGSHKSGSFITESGSDLDSEFVSDSHSISNSQSGSDSGYRSRSRTESVSGLQSEIGSRLGSELISDEMMTVEDNTTINSKQTLSNSESEYEYEYDDGSETNSESSSEGYHRIIIKGNRPKTRNIRRPKIDIEGRLTTQSESDMEESLASRLASKADSELSSDIISVQNIKPHNSKANNKKSKSKDKNISEIKMKEYIKRNQPVKITGKNKQKLDLESENSLGATSKLISQRLKQLGLGGSGYTLHL